ncbi:MAG: UDP-N-acetylmuramoyl-L-alanine--D-glutamate ligase [Candidatus Omnitrophota bacterium]
MAFEIYQIFTMRNTDYYKNKKVVVVGLGRSGVACVNLLWDLGADVSVTDYKDDDSTRAHRLKLKSKAIKAELGRHSQEFVIDKDLLIISPGVPSDASPILWAKQENTLIISEIEFAWSLCPGEIIAITGSNGKTTVTTLIGRILSSSGKQVFICGNIGNPFSQEVRRIREKDFVTLEVSSFQLENIVTFKPKISVILNFTRNHLDRYKNMQEYLEAKKRIFENQDKFDYVVLNQDDPVLRDLAKETKARPIFFSQTKELNPNQAAVVAVGSILGIDQESVLRVLRDFKGIEHRLEQVAEINHIRFINDSKATTADSALWALNNIQAPVILIAGGKDKGVDYGIILGQARQKVKEVILIGEAKEKIAQVLKDTLSIEEAGSLEEAVLKAYRKAVPGDSVLLSPMCSSFDMFSGYEERGNVFKKAVSSLKKNTTKINSNVKIQNSK